MAMTTVNVTKDWTLLTSSVSLIQFKNNSVQVSVGALPTDTTSFFELSSGDFFSNKSNKKLIRIRERTKGGFSWFEGDCMAQNNDSPPIWPDLIKVINQPKELAKEFKNMSNSPPENLEVIFFPIKKEVNKSTTEDNIGKIWKYQTELSIKEIFERKEIRMS